MPQYQFKCDAGHLTELRASIDTEMIGCDCGKPAPRVQVYRDQYMSAETGPKGGGKSEPPREEKSYRKQFAEFQEAAAERDLAYSRVDDPKIVAPNLYKEGVRRAKQRMRK